VVHPRDLVQFSNQVEALQLGDPVGNYPGEDQPSAQSSKIRTYHSLRSFTSLLGDTLATTAAELAGRRLYLNALCAPTGSQFFDPESLSHTLNRCLTHSNIWYPGPEPE
jgi:hypothetical protein